jgi:hypothetical protein
MRLRLLVLMFAVTVLALVSQRPSLATGFCPTGSCIDANIDCVNNGGNPTLPYPTGDTCYELPNITKDIAIATCDYPGRQTYQECYL